MEFWRDDPEPNGRAGSRVRGAGQPWAALVAAVDALRAEVEADSVHALRMAFYEDLL